MKYLSQTKKIILWLLRSVGSRGQELWLVHTARDRDRDRDQGMMDFYIILCIVRTTVHTQEQEQLQGTIVFYCSRPDPGPSPSPCPGSGSVQSVWAITPILWKQKIKRCPPKDDFYICKSSPPSF